MQILLVALGLIILIHSLLFLFTLQKNSELTNKINQLEKNILVLKSDTQKQIPSLEEIKRIHRTSNEGKNKSMKRGNRSR